MKLTGILFLMPLQSGYKKWNQEDLSSKLVETQGCNFSLNIVDIFHGLLNSVQYFKALL